MYENLTSKTLDGLKWSYVSTIVNATIQVLFAAIMARLLAPATFGLMAMAGVVLRFGSYFAQMGVGPAIVQKSELDTKEIQAAFTSSLFLGLIFSVATFALAPFSIYIFDNQEVVTVVRVMGISFILSALSTTSLGLLRRSLQFRSLAIVEIASYVLGYAIVGIALAMNGFGVWSLVASSLCQAGFSAMFSYLFSRHPVALVGTWKYYTSLYSFGGRVSIIGFLEFISSNLDTIAIGHFYEAASLGLYNRAAMLINLPMQYATSSFTRVLIPSFSRIQRETIRVGNAYLSSATLLAAFLFPACITVAAAAHETIEVLLGSKWVGATVVLQILAFVTPLNLLSHLCGVVFEALAILRAKLVIQFGQIVVLLVFIVLLRGWGITGIAIAVGLSELGRHIAYLFYCQKALLLNMRSVWGAYRPGLFSCAITGIGVSVVALLMKNLETAAWIAMLAEYVVAFTILASLLLLTRNKVKAELLSRIGRLEENLTNASALDVVLLHAKRLLSLV